MEVTFTSSDAQHFQVIDNTHAGSYFTVGSYTLTLSASGAKDALTAPWNTPVLINLYGVPDAAITDPQTYAIQFSLSSDDPTYNQLTTRLSR